MFFSIDPQSDVAIYEQIVRQVKLAVADGTLAGGQMLPSVRQLSRDIALNPNTIARAFRELQTQEILEPLRGRGMIVRRDAIDACLDARNELVGAKVRAALADAFAGGMSTDQLREIFEAALSELPPTSADAPDTDAPDTDAPDTDAPDTDAPQNHSKSSHGETPDA